MLTMHGITSKHTNEYGDGSLANPSLWEACRSLVGSFSDARGKFLSENPIVLPADHGPK